MSAREQARRVRLHDSGESNRSEAGASGRVIGDPQIADGVDLPDKPTDLTPAQAALFDLCVNQIVGDHVNGTTSGRLYIVSLLAAAAKRDALIVIGAGLAIPASDVPMVVGLFKGLV